MSGHRCPPPWGKFGAPFAVEVLQVLDSATTTWCDPCRLRYVDMLTEAADRGTVCDQADHAAYPRQVDAAHRRILELLKQVGEGEFLRMMAARDGCLPALDQAARYRAAWMSARRRARRARLAGHTEGYGRAFRLLDAAASELGKR